MTEEQAKTATLDELRDWLAVDDGWDAYDASNGIRVWRRGSFFPKEDERYYEQSMDHPHPPTLDGAAAALPEVWVWTRHVGDDDDSDMWIARKRCKCGPQPVTVHDHGRGHEIEDLYRLAVLCRLAEKAVEK